MAPNTIPTHREICFNCKHMLWMVGIGQGVKCGLTRENIPSREHTCDKFISKHEPPVGDRQK